MRESKEDILKFLNQRILKKYGSQDNFKKSIEKRSYDKTTYEKLLKGKK